MKYKSVKEALRHWKIVDTRPPNNGEKYIAVKNCGGNCEIITATQNFTHLYLNIVIERD